MIPNPMTAPRWVMAKLAGVFTTNQENPHGP